MGSLSSVLTLLKDVRKFILSVRGAQQCQRTASADSCSVLNRATPVRL